LFLEHQDALECALRLRRAIHLGSADRRAEGEAFVEFASTHLEPHFADEEALLARAMVEIEPAELLRAAHARMVEDHRVLAAAIDRLCDASTAPSGEELYAVGSVLTDHVYFERRQLVMLLHHELQAVLADDAAR